MEIHKLLTEAISESKKNRVQFPAVFTNEEVSYCSLREAHCLDRLFVPEVRRTKWEWSWTRKLHFFECC
jgi:hypothetical protein